MRLRVAWKRVARDSSLGCAYPYEWREGPAHYRGGGNDAGWTIYRTLQYSFLALAVSPGTFTETRKAWQDPAFAGGGV